MESKGMPVAEELAQILLSSKAQKKVGLQVQINNHNNINDKHAWLVKKILSLTINAKIKLSKANKQKTKPKAVGTLARTK
jgi:hypothetical protein